MSIRNYILLENASTKSLEFQYSDKNKASGYHSIAGGLHTAIYSVEDFDGEIILQGTLVEIPGNTDWVDILSTTADPSDSTSIPETINFYGNFVWIRAKYRMSNGTIIKIQYNF